MKMVEKILSLSPQAAAARRAEDLLAEAEMKAFDAFRKTKEFEAVVPNSTALVPDEASDGETTFLDEVDRVMYGIPRNARTEVIETGEPGKKFSTAELEEIANNPNLSKQERQIAKKRLVMQYSRGST